MEDRASTTLISFFCKNLRKEFEKLEELLFEVDRRGDSEIVGEEAKNLMIAIGDFFIWLDELCSYLGITVEDCVVLTLRERLFYEGEKVMFELLKELGEELKKKEGELKKEEGKEGKKGKKDVS